MPRGEFTPPKTGDRKRFAEVCDYTVTCDCGKEHHQLKSLMKTNNKVCHDCRMAKRDAWRAKQRKQKELRVSEYKQEPNWTEMEVLLLQAYYGYGPGKLETRELSRIMGKSMAAIHMKATREGLLYYAPVPSNLAPRPGAGTGAPRPDRDRNVVDIRPAVREPVQPERRLPNRHYKASAF
jgi:hypothetical protein